MPKNTERKLLQYLFSGFPAGSAGIALLVLRAVLGVAIIVQGVLCVPGPNGSFGAWCESALVAISGALLVVGLLTPVVAVVIGLVAIAIGVELLPSCRPILFDSSLSITLGAAMLVAITVLGPGALSIDARMFGRREIIIPSLEE